MNDARNKPMKQSDFYLRGKIENIDVRDKFTILNVSQIKSYRGEDTYHQFKVISFDKAPNYRAGDEIIVYGSLSAKKYVSQDGRESYPINLTATEIIKVAEEIKAESAPQEEQQQAQMKFEDVPF